MIKESYEEASLPEAFVRAHIRPAGCISYFHATAKGWLQPEVQYLYDLRLPENGKVVLKPLDGEVESFEASVARFSVIIRYRILTSRVYSSCHSRKSCDICAQASSSPTVPSVRLLRSSPNLFTVAFLYLIGMITVGIEFLIRHGLLTAENEPHLIEIVTRLHGRFGIERW